MNTDNQAQAIEMRISSRLDQVSLLSVCARAIAILNNFSEKQCSEIELAVTEAVTNVIEHAYKADESQPIIMKLNNTADEMVIEVMDQGVTPPETLLKSAKTGFAELPDNIYKIDESGRGLTLILTMMDEVEIVTRDNWNIFRMKKFC